MPPGFELVPVGAEMRRFDGADGRSDDRADQAEAREDDEQPEDPEPSPAPEQGVHRCHADEQRDERQHEERRRQLPGGKMSACRVEDKPWHERRVAECPECSDSQG